MSILKINRKPLAVHGEINSELLMDFISFATREPGLTDGAPCPWFFDNDNNLTAYANSERNMILWFSYLQNEFFRPRGIIVSEPELTDGKEDKKAFKELVDKRFDEFDKWATRLCKIAFVKTKEILEQNSVKTKEVRFG